jgi:hypothetical protein
MDVRTRSWKLHGVVNAKNGKYIPEDFPSATSIAI